MFSNIVIIARRNIGITVVVFTQDTTSWPEVLSEYSWLFGEGRQERSGGSDYSSGAGTPTTSSPGSLGEALDAVFKEHSNLFGEEQH